MQSGRAIVILQCKRGCLASTQLLDGEKARVGQGSRSEGREHAGFEALWPKFT